MADTKTDDTHTSGHDNRDSGTDGDLVERELLVDGMYLEHRDRKRGDVVSLPAEVAERLENLSPPAVAEVGTIEKMEQERAEAEEETQRLREEVRDREFEIARRRKEHHENRLAGDGKTDDDDDDDDDAKSSDGGDGRGTKPSVKDPDKVNPGTSSSSSTSSRSSSSSGSSSGGRGNQSSHDGPTVTKRAGAHNPGSSGRRG